MAPVTGMMQRQLSECIEWARNRQHRGQKLGALKVVAHRIVEMFMRVQTSRLLLYNFAWAKELRRRSHAEASMAKLHIAEAAVANSLDAMQLHGAHGYMLGADAERDLRDVLGVRVASGVSEVQRDILARSIGL